MSGFERLTRKQEALLVALLSERSHQAAAGAGVSAATLRRWLKAPAFVRAYREARWEVLENALAKLQIVTGNAVAALREALKSDKPNVRVRAACAILDRALKGTHLLDLETRLAALEKKAKGTP